MNIDGLKTFVVVCEAGSLSAAAARLDVPVSTISRRIAALEDEIGQPLIERTGRGIRLRERAHEFLTVVRTSLRELEHGIERIRGPAGDALTRLRISAPMEIALSLMSEVLVAARREAPALTLDIIADRRRVAVFEENYDMAIRLGTLLPADLVAQSLGSVSLYLMAAPAYLPRPLSSLAPLAPLAPLDASQTPTVIAIAGLPAHLPYETARGERGYIAMDGPLRVSTFTEAARLAAHGAGIAVMPSYTVKTLATALGLVPVWSESLLPKAPVSAVYPQRNRGASAIALLCRLLRGALADAERTSQILFRAHARS